MPIEAYDFKGNLLRSTRRLVSDYKAIPDWREPATWTPRSFEGSTRYDALNRPIQSIAPHSSLTRAERPKQFNVIQPVFNEANLLERVDVWLERGAEPAALLDPDNEAPSPVGVANIDYDAKGQRLRIDYKNGASTLYSYDPLTFRLTNSHPAQRGCLTRRRPAAPHRRLAGQSGAEPALHLRPRRQHHPHPRRRAADDLLQEQARRAEQRLHLRRALPADPGNRPRTPGAGRHIRRVRSRRSLVWRQRLRGPGGTFAPNDGNAMGTYIERYVYDAVGNFLQMQHRGSDPAQAGLDARYDYVEASLIEDGNGGTPLKTSNRLTRTHAEARTAQLPTGRVLPCTTPTATWCACRTWAAARPGRTCTGTTRTSCARPIWAAAARPSTSTTPQASACAKCGRRRRASPKSASTSAASRSSASTRRRRDRHQPQTATLERETLHVMDDKQRIALVETRTLDTRRQRPMPRQLIRYQFGNHLGSASLELDEQAQIISYEEYAPYGSSTYQAVRSQTETAKRYRYSGKERDNESGLYYSEARYYADWLGRWTAADPKGLVDGSNTYAYVRNNPLSFTDFDRHAM